MVKVPSLVAFMKGVGAVCLGGVILWQVAEHSRLNQGTAIVHVFETPVVVLVDDREYPINTVNQSPLFCEVRSGRHVLSLRRGDRVVFEEEFAVHPGQEVVLSAWAPQSDSSIHSTQAADRSDDPPPSVDVSPDDRR